MDRTILGQAFAADGARCQLWLASEGHFVLEFSAKEPNGCVRYQKLIVDGHDLALIYEALGMARDRQETGIVPG